ncbi:hypothetical protein QQS21_002275 [Conoideocrella luteorostrata]|uniref:Apopolysialoglycoprotein n=1 Tax=Conoideocrella luteorostrata TaxID=1105319 RepID=A0AAJ0CYJ6_9HYPO|nr:hypothetical protein QQS21_002275 [Conoideocrella luteorostrata]
MAPGTRRANRGGYAEHDDFEGLPVRQWRHDWVNVAPPQPQELLQQNDIWAIELIHGLPKDAPLLAPHSQELLRAARSGRLYKRPAPAEEEDAEAEAAQAAEKAEKKEDNSTAPGFSIKLWKQIPRNNEGSGVSHLAKRRKGTVTIASKTIEDKVAAPTVTRATVRRTDAAGNPYTEEVTLADGHQVVGEIISTRVEVAPTAPNGFVAPPPPPRRRPMPPKRKSKGGPGRGKRKIKNPLPGEGVTAGVAGAANGAAGAVQVDGQSENSTLQEGNGTPNPDSEIADDDDDDDDGDGEDGEEGDDDDQEDGAQPGDDADDSKIQDEEMTDVVDESKPSTPGKLVVDAMDGITTQPGVVPLNPLTIAPPLVGLATNSPKAEGSPLKNVLMQSKSPTEPQAPPAIPTNAADVTPVPAAAPIPPPVLAIESSDIIDARPPKTESLIAEPASTVAGDERAGPGDVDIPMVEAAAPESVPEEPFKIDEQPEQPEAEEARKVSPPMAGSPDEFPTREEALLPPPPEQVGNISSPKTDDGPDRGSDLDDKSRSGHRMDSDLIPERPPFNPQNSAMTEDTIKPEDSASVRFPFTESGAPSEVGTGSFIEETKDSAAASAEPPAEAPKDPSPAKVTSPSAESKANTLAPAVSDHDAHQIAPVEESDQPKVPAAPKQDSPLALESSATDVGQPAETRATPLALGQDEAVPEAKEPTPPEVPELPSDEPGSVPDAPREEPVVENPRQEPQAQADDVPMLEPESAGEAKVEPTPYVPDQLNEVPKEELKEEIMEAQKDETLEQHKDEPIEPARDEPEPAEHPRDEPMAEAKPILEPEAHPEPVPQPALSNLLEKAPPVEDAALGLSLHPILPPIVPPVESSVQPPVLPPMEPSVEAPVIQPEPIAEAQSTEEEEKKEDPPADA